MLNQLPPIITTSGQAAPSRPLAGPAGAASGAPERPSAVPGPVPDEPVAARLQQVVAQAARELFPGREVAVESFYDEESGRYVHRIADGASGELLLQTPPDELLRFFASGRELFDQPLVRVDA